ncbi:MAG: FAD-dependent thymidylate synthase [Aquificaceae bacterium]|nr:FAD-dependent thymidylate synthase [Aquificaceae bacterium]
MKGFVMGSDQRVVRCARVSFGKDEQVNRERDIKLISYLLRHRHASPFEHVIIAMEGSKDLWLRIVGDLPSPAVQVYYSGNYLWLNLRNYINARELFPEELENLVSQHLPATMSLFMGKEPEGYSTDDTYLKEKLETSSGWVGLVDNLELGTDMDYYTFVVECPLFVARQWHRHRFGSYNEISRRYVDYEPDFYAPTYLRKQAQSNKQASLEEAVGEPWNSLFLKKINWYVQDLKELYKAMMEKGVARELARGILPQFMKTRFYWTVPRVSLDNFITLRTHEGAQREIREFALAIESLVGYRGSDKKLRL